MGVKAVGYNNLDRSSELINDDVINVIGDKSVLLIPVNFNTSILQG